MTQSSIARRALTAAVATAALASATTAQAAENGKFRVGIVTFLSGAAAGPFGVPSAHAAETVIDALNKGQLPAPYNTKGINGMEIEAVIIDENGGATKQVEEFRNLVERQKVDAVIGYISSGDCLAISPVAEELKIPTIMYDCGTSRLFVENKAPKYVFRTGLDAVVDNVGAARYLADTRPKMASFAGIQQNYAWGQDSWVDFVEAMKHVKPTAKVAAEQFPKIFQGQYGAEISALSVAKPDVIHSSFWGGDMEALVLQGGARGLYDGKTLVLTCGETGIERYKGQAPNGTVIGGRGPFGAFAPKNALSDWLRTAYRAKWSDEPIYPSFKMAQAILALKTAVEKAAPAGKQPSSDQIVAAMTGITFESPSGTVKMARASGHQAMQGIAYGEYHYESGRAVLKNVKSYADTCVTPPDGTNGQEWIKAGMPGAKCD
ncbi:ABC transporter substrate-binding protein [Paramagnetospirillum marisnigri]|uniref:ABC transporter substrate-binding protein n=1 Tax=Paramagnetospirillum marisnigri TaxID=1285242 RepID=A0A178MFF2_9PROT|nr:ABC transporter substrate-binding protein [Paramagnetospirillum marisnigri]OAN46785.1 ABC transporter substrate-binding protein [Paramagnetospirillum marisnigri]